LLDQFTKTTLIKLHHQASMS